MTGNEMAKAVKHAAELLLLEEVEYSLGLDGDHLGNYMVSRKAVSKEDLADALTQGAKYVGLDPEGRHVLEFDVREEDAQAALDADIEAHRKRSAELLTLAKWLTRNYGGKVVSWHEPSE